MGARVGSCGDDAPAACCSRCRACLDCCSDHEEAFACFSDGCAEAMQDCVEKSEAARALQDNLACSAQGLTHGTKSTALTTTSIHRLLAARRLRFPFSPTKNPTRETTPKSFHPIHSDFPSAAKCFTLWPPTPLHAQGATEAVRSYFDGNPAQPRTVFVPRRLCTGVVELKQELDRGM